MIELTFLPTTSQAVRVVRTVPKNSQGDEFVNNAVLAYIQKASSEEQFELRRGRELFWKIGPINSSFIPADLKSIPRLLIQSEMVLDQQDLHLLERISKIYAETLLTHLSGDGANSPMFSSMFEKMAETIALRCLKLAKPQHENYVISVEEFQDTYMSELDTARTAAEKEITHMLSGICSANLRRDRILRARENAKVETSLQQQSEYLLYVNDPDPNIRNSALDLMLSYYRKDQQGANRCLHQIKHLKEQKLIEIAKANADALLEQESSKKRPATKKPAVLKQPSLEPSTNNTRVTTKNNRNREFTPLGSVEDILQQGRSRLKLSKDTTPFQTVSFPSKPCKPKTQPPSLEEKFYRYLRAEENPCSYHLAHRVERWEAGEYDEIKKFIDPLMDGGKKCRYQNMSDNQLLEQIQRHHFPGLDQLMNSPWFKENYCQLTDKTWFLKVQREDEKGTVLWPLTLMSVSTSQQTIYHAFAHPTQEILSSNGPLQPSCSEELWEKLQSELDSTTGALCPPVNTLPDTLPFQILTPPLDPSRKTLPRIRLTKPHTQSKVGFAVFYPLNNRHSDLKSS